MVTVKLGTKDNMVTVLQYLFNTKVSGTADAELVSAVKSYQQKKKLLLKVLLVKILIRHYLMTPPPSRRVKIKVAFGTRRGSTLSV